MKYPVAYLITFTTYGTWLHDDKRGSVDDKHNCYGDDFVVPDLVRCRKEQTVLKNPPFVLNKNYRKAALNAILKVCGFRNWFAHAVHVRNNHIHIVVSGEEKPEKMMTDFKAYATRAIRCFNGNQTTIKKFWTQHGSTKYLWTKSAVVSAVNYVKNEQGRMMEFASSKSCRAPNVSEG